MNSAIFLLIFHINRMDEARFQSQSQAFRPKSPVTTAGSWVIKVETRERTAITAQIAIRSERLVAVLLRIAIEVGKTQIITL